MKTVMLKHLIHLSKGKFFTLTFRRKDGVERTVNGKNYFKKFISNSPTKRKKPEDLVSIVDRNKGQWCSTTGERVIRFKCGPLEWNERRQPNQKNG